MHPKIYGMIYVFIVQKIFVLKSLMSMCVRWLRREIKRIKEKEKFRAGESSAVDSVNMHVNSDFLGPDMMKD